LEDKFTPYPIGLKITAHTWEYFNEVSYKYEHLADILGISFHEAVIEGMATILKNTSFLFMRMIRKANIEEEVEFEKLHMQFDTMAKTAFEGKVVEMTKKYISVNGQIYMWDSPYLNLFPEMDLLIEYVILCLLRQRSKLVYNKVNSYTGEVKEVFTMDEAVEFTGYKKSYLYKAKSKGRLKAVQRAKKSKLMFKREDLEKFMYKKETMELADFL
jgi:hypothetical protein